MFYATGLIGGFYLMTFVIGFGAMVFVGPDAIRAVDKGGNMAAPLLAEVALKFGPPEFFAIQLLTFSSFVGLGGGNPLKSLATILIGFMLSTVGLDIVTGQLRLTYGFTDLMKGFDFIIAVIGLFGIGEILLSVEEGLRFQGAKTDMNMRVVLDTCPPVNCPRATS